MGRYSACSRRSVKGFTLIELLITLMIMGVLIGVVAISYKGALDRAHDTSLKSDLLANDIKIQKYYEENHHKYPLNQQAVVDQFSVSDGNVISYVGKANQSAYCLEIKHGGDSTRIFRVTNRTKDPRLANCSDLMSPTNAPTGVTASVDDDSVSVSWTAPASDGGSPITGYVVSSNPNSKVVNVGQSTLTAEFTDLVPGGSYVFVVWAINDIGSSTPSVQSNLVSLDLLGPQIICGEDDYSIGDVGPGGGRVFYVDGDCESDGFKYLEAAPSGWYPGVAGDPGPASSPIVGVEYGCYGVLIPGVQEDDYIPGAGKSNTEYIVNQPCYTEAPGNKVAAKLAYDYSNNGYKDWWLPSVAEIGYMCQNKGAASIGGLSNESYWTSSQYSDMYAWSLYMNGCWPGFDPKGTEFLVRPIRGF